MLEEPTAVVLAMMMRGMTMAMMRTAVLVRIVTRKRHQSTSTSGLTEIPSGSEDECDRAGPFKFGECTVENFPSIPAGHLPSRVKQEPAIGFVEAAQKPEKTPQYTRILAGAAPLLVVGSLLL
jgi:hypothetical protein